MRLQFTRPTVTLLMAAVCFALTTLVPNDWVFAPVLAGTVLVGIALVMALRLNKTR